MARISGLAPIAQRLDAPHQTGVAVLWSGSRYAFAVVDSSSGEVVAWDGWYLEDRPAGSTDVRELPWDDWDDMPSKLLHRANAPWLGGPAGYWLMPSYSVAENAGELVRTHRATPSDPDSDRQIAEAEWTAYFPVVDEQAFRAATAR